MIRVSIDKHELTDWIDNFRQSRLNIDNELFIPMLTRIANEILRRAIERTPVRTGDLRRHWRLGDITVSGTEIGIEIINDSYHDLPQQYGKENTGYYATQIEYGFRFPDGNWYEGRFMLTTSINEVLPLIPKTYSNAFVAWIKGRGL